MDADEARTIGRRLRQIRKARRKSLVVIAGLAGISKSKLARIELGELALDKLSDIVALAGALQLSPSDLIRLPIPAPANGHTDSTTEAVGQALDAIEDEDPDGLVLPVAVLRDQLARIHAQRRACQFAEMATDLPGLIRNLHTTLATRGTDTAQRRTHLSHRRAAASGGPECSARCWPGASTGRPVWSCEEWPTVPVC